MVENGLRAFQRAKISHQDTQLNTISCIFKFKEIKLNSVKVLKRSPQDRLSLNAGQKYCRMLPLEHSAILLTFIKLLFVIKIFVCVYSKWPYKTGFAYT